MSSSNDIILEIKDLNKIYPSNVHALKNVKLSIKRGEFVILLGLSGSGKSTLLRCINRLIEPSSGSILFYDEDITQLNLKDLRKHGVVLA